MEDKNEAMYGAIRYPARTEVFAHSTPFVL